MHSHLQSVVDHRPLLQPSPGGVHHGSCWDVDGMGSRRMAMNRRTWCERRKPPNAIAFDDCTIVSPIDIALLLRRQPSTRS